MDPTPILLLLAIGLLVGAAIAQAKHIANHKPTRITGWWHYRHPDDGRPFRNDDIQWRTACEQSRAASRARRGRFFDDEQDDH